MHDASRLFDIVGNHTYTRAPRRPPGQRGSPVTFTASGRSASNVFAATETFAHYNKPVTITAP